MSALSWTFVPNKGTAVHVANSTKSNTRTVNALCGKRFARADVRAASGQATCDKCRRLDDPFHVTKVPYDPTTWPDQLLRDVKCAPNARTALLSRDLITPAGDLTPRGVVLARDLTAPSPWIDDQGVTHVRLPGARRLRGACGAVLLGISHLAGQGEVNFRRLAAGIDLYDGTAVDCMSCLTVSAGTP